jgi:hypothetical protein
MCDALLSDGHSAGADYHVFKVVCLGYLEPLPVSVQASAPLIKPTKKVSH